MVTSRRSVQQYLIIFGVVLMPAFAAFAEPFTGTVALQLLAGRNFKFRCGDVLNGYGQFDRRGSVWAAFKHSSDAAAEPERRANAIVRAQGPEICFTVEGLGETCVPVTEKSSGIYRFGTKEDWCDVQVIQHLPPHIKSVDSR